MTRTLDDRSTSLSRNNRIGLGLAALLGLADIGLILLPAPEQGDGPEGPPVGILVLAAVLGLVTLVAVAKAWRTGSRRAVRLTAGLRVLSVITALPAFFVDVDASVKVLVAVLVLVTTASVVLMLSPASRRGPVLD